MGGGGFRGGGGSVAACFVWSFFLLLEFKKDTFVICKFSINSYKVFCGASGLREILHDSALMCPIFTFTKYIFHLNNQLLKGNNIIIDNLSALWL